MNDAQFNQRMQRIEALLEAVQKHGNAVVRASAVELVQALLEMHAAGFARVLEISRARAGEAIVHAFTADELISQLLLLHGLHPVDLEMRVRQAMEQVRPLLAGCGVHAEVVQVTHEAVRLKLDTDNPEIHALLEDAILSTAPDVLRIEFVALDAGRLSLPLVQG